MERALVKKKPIKKGDYFLLPFVGKRRQLLVQVIRPRLYQHECRFVDGGRAMFCLEACQRVGPAEANRILGAGKKP